MAKKVGLEQIENSQNPLKPYQSFILETWYLVLILSTKCKQDILFPEKSWFINQNSKLESKAPSTKMKRMQTFRPENGDNTTKFM